MLEGAAGIGPLFLDLDGVVLDVSERYYRVHLALLAGLGGKVPDRHTFWGMKRAARPLEELLAACGVSGPAVTAYRAGWLDRIESPELLGLDAPIGGAVEALGELAAQQPLVLVTLRQRPEGVIATLDRLGLSSFVRVVLTASPREAEGWRVKAGLLADSGLAGPGRTIVGDTEVDVRAGKALRMRTVAVTSGIRDRDRLEAERPDLIFDSLHAGRRALGPAGDPR
jgi:phosphoglycolate phosphatase-like HAD superfamily hydrolase